MMKNAPLTPLSVVVGPAPVSTPSTLRMRSRRKWEGEVDEDVTVYKPRLSVIGGGLVALAILFFGLTLPLIIEGASVPMGQLLGLAGFWLIGIAVTVVPLGFKLEVGDDYIKTYFAVFMIKEISSSDVENIKYENITAWGIPVGKGIKIWIRDTSRSGFSIKPKWAFDASIGESVYGKEAIAHARRVLESKQNTDSKSATSSD